MNKLKSTIILLVIKSVKTAKVKLMQVIKVLKSRETKLATQRLIKKTQYYLRLLSKRQYLKIGVASFVIVFGLLLGVSILSQIKAIRLQVPHINGSLDNRAGDSLLSDKNLMYDPFNLVEDIQTNNSLVAIIDIRSKTEYEQGHIRNAINIPVYMSLSHLKDSVVSDSVLIAEFSKIKASSIVIYGNSASSTIPLAVKNVLAKHNISTQVLSIGWNEWHDFRNIWVPQALWDNFDIDRYSVIKSQ